MSRYGIIPTACSGEQVGVCAADAESIRDILTAISGYDSKDGTSLPTEKYDYSVDISIAGIKLAAMQELYDAADESVKEKINKYISKLKSIGVFVDFVSVPEVKAYATAWQIMLSAETCNNISRYEGVKFGYRTPEYKNIDDLYVKSRTEGMGFHIKMNVLYGSDVLSKNKYIDCYDKSLRIRRLASEKMKEIFSDYDAVICPVMSISFLPEYSLLETFERTKKELLFTAVPNLIGIPAMVTEGVQLWAPAYGESLLLSIASKIERMPK